MKKIKIPAEIQFLGDLGKGMVTGAVIGAAIGATCGLLTVALSALAAE